MNGWVVLAWVMIGVGILGLMVAFMFLAAAEWYGKRARGEGSLRDPHPWYVRWTAWSERF